MIARTTTIVLAFSVLAISGAIVACSPSVVAEQQAELPAPSAAHGKQVWSENCARCHLMRDPKDLTNHEWPAVIRHMRVRANLSGQDERDMLELFIKAE